MDLDGMDGSGEVELVVKFIAANKTFSVAFCPASTTVADLKRLCEERSALAADAQRLVYSGHVVKDTDNLSALGFKSGHTLYLVRKPAPQPVPATQSSVRDSAKAEQEFTRKMLSLPAVKAMMSNPEFLKTLLASRPEFKDLMEKNPEYRHILSDSKFLSHIQEVASNPKLQLEFVRGNDRALSNFESIPGGFNVLRKFYSNIQDSCDKQSSGSSSSSGENIEQASAKYSKPEDRKQAGFTSEPLPNPWQKKPTTPQRSHCPLPGMFSPFGFPQGVAGGQGMAGGPSDGSLGESSSDRSRARPQDPQEMGMPPSWLNFGRQWSPGPSFATQDPGSQMNRADGAAGFRPPGFNPLSPFFMGDESSSSSAATAAFERNQAMMNPAFAALLGFNRPHGPGMAPGMGAGPGFPSPFFGAPAASATPAMPPPLNPSATSMAAASAPGSGFANPAGGVSADSLGSAGADLEARYQSELSQMEEMGFPDKSKNLRALLSAGGHVASAVDYLLRDM